MAGDDSDGFLDRWLSVPRAVVRFVRENRNAVIGGSIGVLLALWLATALTTGRRK